MLCAYLAGALLIGLLGNALFGAWWLDPAVRLLIAAVAVKEGVVAWKGEGCCVSAYLPRSVRQARSKTTSVATDETIDLVTRTSRGIVRPSA